MNRPGKAILTAIFGGVLGYVSAQHGMITSEPSFWIVMGCFIGGIIVNGS